jgi:uncharacterized protein (TIGR00255 family)
MDVLAGHPMIRSMTGFGRAEVAAEALTVIVEARSVNHRHLDVGVRLPNALAGFDADLRRLVQGRVERGRVEVSVQTSPAGSRAARTIRVDAALVRRYAEEARTVRNELGVAEGVTAAWLLERPGVVELTDAPPLDAPALWPAVADAVSRALDELVARRESEGAALASELRALAAALAGVVDQMTGRAPVAATRREERLRERMAALLAGTPIDESRVATEVAVWATKTDVTEELARLRAHLGEFGLMLDKGGSVGRQFDFLIQEMHREVNTVASKADDLELSQAALAGKGLLEKVREQVQNLE